MGVQDIYPVLDEARGLRGDAIGDPSVREEGIVACIQNMN